MSSSDFTYSDFVFTPEALEIFKKIFLSCTYQKDILDICRPFFELKGDKVNLEETKKWVKTGTDTIFAYKLFNPSQLITIEDMLLAFACEGHLKKMRDLYEKNSSNIWNQLFGLKTYLISHLVKPVQFVSIENGIFCARFSHQGKKINFEGIRSFGEISLSKYQFLHFGLIVYQTDDKDLVNQIAKTFLLAGVLQKTRKIKKISYQDSRLINIYLRNILFYNSLKT